MANARIVLQFPVMSLLLQFRIFLEPPIKTQSHHAEESLSKDTATHLAHSLTAIHKDNRHLLDLETNLIGSELHLNLETIALEADGIKIDSLQYLAAIADESCCGIMYLETGNETHVLGSEIAHQYATDRPVHHVDTRNITGTDGYIVALIVGSRIEARQIIRVVAEVGIHFEDEVITLLQRPFETHDIGCAQAQLTRTLQDMETVGKLIGHQLLNDVSSSVRTTVIDNKDVEFLLQAKTARMIFSIFSFSLYVGMITILSLIMF